MNDCLFSHQCPDQDGFQIRFDFFPEWIPVRVCFYDSFHDVAEYEKQIESGELEWFIVRCTVSLCGVDLGSSSLGGNLYKIFNEWLESEGTGYVADLQIDAMQDAQNKLQDMFKKNHREID